MRRLLPALLCAFSFTLNAQELPAWISPEGLDDPHVGQVLDTANGIWLTPAMLVESLVSAPHVLVGEKHDNPDHHRLQLWLLQRLHEVRPQASLLMEMIDPSQQAAVDRLQGKLTDEAQLPAELAWGEGWDWTLYGPLVRWGLVESQHLLTANISQDEMKAIYQNPDELAGIYSAQAREVLNDAIATSHCGKLPQSQFPAMLAVQQQRDQRMAKQLADAPKNALLMAGNYHVRKDIGIPLHWPVEGVAPPLVVMLIEAGGALPDRSQADFVWLTAAMPEIDYCAQWE
ncbi:MAG: putative iron-regulated protein [Halopseudomonas sp.]|jgi:uncharacterized iron-regulated protein|uniref:ChaN family lipoprotein n=1 Tax=Halopseudomonas sp. TaxID=2901191 RepID=UPI0039E5302A